MEQLRNVAPCADCGGIVAPSAVSCPHCGSTEFSRPVSITNTIVEKMIRRILEKPEGKLTGADLEKVTGLSFGEREITDAGLREVAKCKDLKTLYLYGNQITNAGLKEVAKLQKLEWLSLGNTKITDAGLVELAKLQQLKTLSLKGTQTTKAGVAELQKVLPNCDIKGP